MQSKVYTVSGKAVSPGGASLLCFTKYKLTVALWEDILKCLSFDNVNGEANLIFRTDIQKGVPSKS